MRYFINWAEVQPGFARTNTDTAADFCRKQGYTEVTEGEYADAKNLYGEQAWVEPEDDQRDYAEERYNRELLHGEPEEDLLEGWDLNGYSLGGNDD